MDTVGEGVAVRLRVFCIPIFATSHLISMFDVARLMAGRPGVEVTMVVTPANAELIRPNLAWTSVRLLLYPFPSAEAGLPEGLENLSAVPPSDTLKVEKAVLHVKGVHERIIRDHRPDAVIADFHCGWAIRTARELGIAGITFGALGVFPQLVMGAVTESLERRKEEEDEKENEPFVVVGLPGPRIEMVRSELPDFFRPGDGEEVHAILWEAWEAQSERYGTVVNTFYELEPEYCDTLRGMGLGKAWFVGPVSLSCSGDDAGALLERGGAAEGRDKYMGWLGSQEEASVVYVCFGSWCQLPAEQLKEIALGLEASGCRFIWVVRGAGVDEKEWMPEGWEERVAARGLVVRGWAPQAAILNHAAVGAFMTHCGWNSLLEAVSGGVPMLTWPLVAEQFINERLVLGIMGAGGRVWDGFRSTTAAERVVVPGEAIATAVSRFMEAGGTGEQARMRVREYAALARAAMAEGGSSRRDLDELVDDLILAAAGGGGGHPKPDATYLYDAALSFSSY